MTGLLLVLVGMSLADEPLDVTKIPDAVKVTIAREWPTAHAVSATTDGKEVEVVLQWEARRMEVAFDQDGSWSQIEEKVDMASMPSAVVSAAAAEGTILGAEKRTLKGGKTDFEVQVKADNGKIKELRLDDEGHAAVLDRVPEPEDEDNKEEKDEKY